MRLEKRKDPRPKDRGYRSYRRAAVLLALAALMALGKIAMSRILHETARVETEIVGAEAMLAGPENPVGDAVTFRTMNAYFTSIGGGTDQIQRNIVGERVLGLPKEPEPYRNTPFRDLPH